MSAPLVLADTALRPYKKQIKAAFKRPIHFADLSDPHRLEASLEKTQSRGRDLQLVLPGVFGTTSAPSPIALNSINIPSDAVRSGKGASWLGVALQSALAELTPDDIRKANAFLRLWKNSRPDPWYTSRASLVSVPTSYGSMSLARSGETEFTPNVLPDMTSVDLPMSLFIAMQGWSSLPAFLQGLDVVAGENAERAAQMVAAHLLCSRTIWLDPYDKKSISAEDALDILTLFRRTYLENDKAGFCIGAQTWNHPSIRATFSGQGGVVRFCQTVEDAIAGARDAEGKVLSWASKTTPEIEMACSEAQVSLVRIEDGFLRSVGLGAGLARGASLAADDMGIYYDPSRPSRLELLLKDYDLSEEELKRAGSLRERVVSAKISKYNFGKASAFDFPKGRKILLVPGQVADDAAIRMSRSATIDCANTPNVNFDLLTLARQRNPDAYIVFKPHPDVETGLRKGRLGADQTTALADHVARDANIIDLIEACDQIETFSSLSGFEALVRGKSVTVHGMPFYAGWGLSEDLTPCPQRTRTRSIDEMLYLALVIYARSIDPVSLLPCSPEFLISRLRQQRASKLHHVVTTVKREASWLGRKLGI